MKNPDTTETQQLMLELVQCGMSDPYIARTCNLSDTEFDCYLKKHVQFCFAFDEARRQHRLAKAKQLAGQLSDDLPAAVLIRQAEQYGLMDKTTDTVIVETPDLDHLFEGKKK